MAYIDQAKKAELSPNVKSICEKFGIKASLAIRRHSTLVLNVKKGPIDFWESYQSKREEDGNNRLPYAKKSISVNPYHYDKMFEGKALEFLTEVIEAMNNGNHDNSRSQEDYFDVGWYIDVNIGDFDKHYICTK